MAELNGKPVSVDQLKTLALTGYGHFTSMRVEEGRVRGLSLHLERLVRDCRALFDAELDPQHVQDLARRVAPSEGACVVRVTVFDPNFDMGHPGAKADPQVLVTTRPAANLPLSPMRVQTRKYVRDLPSVKSVGLFGQLLHRRAAQLDGFDDALFVDEQSLVSEGGTWNIGFFDGDRVIWPEADILVGVTMQLLKATHEHDERRVQLADIAGMQAVFATNSAIGVRAISGVDETTLTDDHPIIDTLRKAYMEVPADPL
ncbi:aminotransferase class IV family protein [Streptomyces sp. PKU-EA00015]|uniref:aminotransferase class IV family protein n=1 Tax=Streptomyces sp. PKU-EA00015 TaxID=2748326 RepID=UPI0015A3B343|nr:aminotransferase class IV family protein [Streptomyces sp. PKU-EA00015]NWF28280.1 aminotransferase class IV family protein [Streptomyces sp. PKU-EA00015]